MVVSKATADMPGWLTVWREIHAIGDMGVDLRACYIIAACRMSALSAAHQGAATAA